MRIFGFTVRAIRDEANNDLAEHVADLNNFAKTGQGSVVEHACLQLARALAGGEADYSG